MAPPLVNWKVLSKKTLAQDVFELRLQKPPEFSFKGGQYLSIVIPGAGPGGRNLRRAYSIASAPEMPEVELCVKLVEKGPGTNYLNSLDAGSELQAQAPFGDFVLEHDLSLPTLFIGTGTGLAPLRSMLLSKDWELKAPTSFLLGVRHEQDIIYPELFTEQRIPQLKDQKHVQMTLSRPSDAWRGFKGRVTDYLRQEMTDWDFKSTHYYMCGSGAMLSEVKEWLGQTHGVTKEQFHTEKYY